MKTQEQVLSVHKYTTHLEPQKNATAAQGYGKSIHTADPQQAAIDY